MQYSDYEYEQEDTSEHRFRIQILDSIERQYIADKSCFISKKAFLIRTPKNKLKLKRYDISN